MNFKKAFNDYKQLIPIIFLTFYCIDAVVTAFEGTVVMEGRVYNFELTIKHYIAFSVIFINLITFFFYKAFFKYVLLVTILLGLFNIITFSVLTTTVGINGLMGVQPSAFLSGLLAYILNFKRATKWIIKNIRTNHTPEQVERIEKQKFIEEIQKFVSRYKGYSTNSLHQIVRENEFVPAAIEAAKQLIEEREKQNSI